VTRDATCKGCGTRTQYPYVLCAACRELPYDKQWWKRLDAARKP